MTEKKFSMLLMPPKRARCVASAQDSERLAKSFFDDDTKVVTPDRSVTVLPRLSFCRPRVVERFSPR